MDNRSLSIIISVHERQSTLKRLLPFVKKITAENNIYIVDSSTAQFPGKEFISPVNYLHNPGLNFYENVFSALERINTKYVIHLNDDDFVLEPAIERIIGFLEQNEDYSMAQGLHLKIEEGNGKILKNYGVESYYLQIKKESTYRNDFLDRVKYMFYTFISPNHSVIKSEVLKEAYSFVLKHKEYFPIRFFDKIIGLFIALRGRQKTLEVLYQLRSTSRIIKAEDYPEVLKRGVGFSEIFRLMERENDPFMQLLSEETELPIKVLRKELLVILRNYDSTFKSGIIAKTRRSITKRSISDKVFSKPCIRERIIDNLKIDYQNEIKKIKDAVVKNPIKE